MSLLWRVLEGRSTEWTYCMTDKGWELATQDERHTFFGTTERTTYTCEDTPSRPVAAGPRRWPVSCTTGEVDEVGIGRLVGSERLRVGGELVAAEHIRKKTQFSGGTRGYSQHDHWFDVASGVPVKIVMVSRTTNDSPVGEVTYDEEVTLVLTSLEPRR